MDADSSPHLWMLPDPPDAERRLRTGQIGLPGRRHPLVVEIDRLRVELADVNRANAGLEIAVQHSREIGAAVGIVMATCHVDVDRAHDMLAETADNTHRELHEVAAAVVHEGVLAAHP